MTPAEQRKVALSLANGVRCARARLHREIAALDYDVGLERLAELLLDPPEFLNSATIHDVLCWPVRMGPQRVDRLLRPLHISPYRRVDSIPPRQRRMLADRLEGMRP